MIVTRRGRMGGRRGGQRLAAAGGGTFFPGACSVTGSPAPVDTGTASPVSSSAPDSGGCKVVPQGGVLRSNTLLNMTVDSDEASDRVTFTLGPIAPGPTGGTGRLAAVSPPFSQAGSGATVDVLGSHFVELHLDGMLIADDTGQAVYRGPTSLRPAMIAIRDIEQTDGSEEVYNFIIGYAGSGRRQRSLTTS